MDTLDTQLAQLDQWARAIEVKSKEISEKYPGLPWLTTIIMAQDAAGADRWDEDIKAGRVTVEQGCRLVGSYARFGFALDHLPERLMYEDIADLWRGSDPDDTDPRFLDVWQRAAIYHHGPVTDGRDLPAPRKGRLLTVYRGQMEGDPFGIAWTTDKGIASKFARGAGLRISTMLGVIYEGYVYPGDVLGYLTGRGESEIVVDPKNVLDPRVVARWCEAEGTE